MKKTEEAVEKLTAVRKELEGLAFEREREILAGILALLTRQHCFIFGVPGLAKSLLIRELCKRIEGTRYFEHLLSREVTADELFVSETHFVEKELGSGSKSVKFENDLAGKAADAEVVFLDEMFKGNATLLNALLSLLQERIYHNGAQVVRAPLVSLFAASNELPDPEEGLAALFDRILFRVEAKPIAEKANRIAFSRAQVEKRERQAIGEAAYAVSATITLEELKLLQDEVAMIAVPDLVHEKLFELFVRLTEEGIVITDRRYGRLPLILQASALLARRDTVSLVDFTNLQYILWDDPKDQQTVRKVILEFANPLENEALRLFDAVGDAVRNALAGGDQKLGVEAGAKLKTALAELNRLKAEAESQQLPTDKIEELINKLRENQKEVLKTCFGIED
ncbi:MAG: ATPase RavA [Syntrophomonadaceae bacterium]|nr:ATPase RavA [Bacillota bacterium]